MRMLEWATSALVPGNAGTGAAHWVFARHIPASICISKSLAAYVRSKRTQMLAGRFARKRTTCARNQIAVA
jgi:hypothetical protein